MFTSSSMTQRKLPGSVPDANTACAVAASHSPGLFTPSMVAVPWAVGIEVAKPGLANQDRRARTKRARMGMALRGEDAVGPDRTRIRPICALEKAKPWR